MRNLVLVIACAAAVGILPAYPVRADVFDMGPGLVSLETVHVGSAGNLPDETGYGAVGYTYDIGKYEVTVGQYTEFLNAVAGIDTYGLYNVNMNKANNQYGCNITRSGSGTLTDPFNYAVASDWANRPVNFVSWGDGARFANWLHNGQPIGSQDMNTTEDGAYCLDGATSAAELLAVSREVDWQWAITSEDEWYKAAYHDPSTGSYYEYPTSSNSLPSYVQPGQAIPSPDPGNYATYGEDEIQMGIGAPYYRTEAAEHENSQSPHGTYDMGGNVWELNEAVFDGTRRGARGGSIDATSPPGFKLASSHRTGFEVTHEGNDIGFRVVQVPEPTTLSLLALGGAALLRRRRRR